ncbi:hypothetical protein LSH36_102g08042 [Paralvinella palmiformis]|uniref:Uncharacterized protein n=1 Tax=Paralvinella palmiformis TaxID=53620 RepID=A0AAD9K033_9ANNE|nr:hypothetical protein LSH36_102g08042 [Paralvinella palmiformis]
MSARMKAAFSGKDLAKRLANRDAKECANSVFHVPLPTPSCTDCAEGLADISKFANRVKQMCGAGTHAAERLSALLLGTSYQEIAGQFLLLQKQLDSEMDGITSQVTLELDNFMKQLSRDGDKLGKGDDDVKNQGHRADDLQLVAMGLALMVQLQQQFFITAMDKMAYFSQNHALNNTNGLNIEAKLKPALPKEQCVHQVAGQVVSSSSSGVNVQEMSAHISSAGPTSSSGSKSHASSWNRDAEREAGSSLDGHVLAAGQMSATHIQAGLGNVSGCQNNTNVHLPAKYLTGSALAPGGLVSEEEIDVVIDMLSRATKYTAPPGGDPVEAQSMPAPISSNPSLVGPIQHPVLLSKAPGSHLSSNNNGQYLSNISYNDHPIKYGVRAAQHRQSDSFIVDCHMNNEMKMNTWPIRPHVRDSVPLWQGTDSPRLSAYDSHITGEPAVHPDVAFGYVTSGATKYPLMPGFGAGPWSTAPDSVVNKAWPVFPIVRDCDPVPTQWTGVADSSSCSDESSSNSDMQWIMGVNLMGVMNVKRRHSSGGDTAASSSGSHVNNINKSVDNLMESKSANTWPPKHPWTNKQCDANLTPDCTDGGMIKGLHKPLTPQWSDPLATRSLAVWDTGLTGSLSQQSFGSVSVGGGDFKAPNAMNIQDEEKCF